MMRAETVQGDMKTGRSQWPAPQPVVLTKLLRTFANQQNLRCGRHESQKQCVGWLRPWPAPKAGKNKLVGHDTHSNS